MPKKIIDAPEYWDNFWDKKKAEIMATIHMMVEESDGRDINVEELQTHAHHMMETAAINYPIRLKKSMIREIEHVRLTCSDHPEFRHFVTPTRTDVIRVAAALGMEELERRHLEREKMKGGETTEQKTHQEPHAKICCYLSRS